MELKYEYYLKTWGATISNLIEDGILQEEPELYFSSKKDRDAYKELLLAAEKYARTVRPDRLYAMVLHEEQGPQVRFFPVLNAIILHKGEYKLVSERWSFPKEENSDPSIWDYILEYKFDVASLAKLPEDEFSIISTFLTYEHA